MDGSPPRGNPQPGDPYLWTVPVYDPFDREVELKVGVRRVEHKDGRREARVAVLLPAAGDGCTITQDNADYLSAVVKAASERAGMQR